MERHVLTVRMDNPVVTIRDVFEHVQFHHLFVVKSVAIAKDSLRSAPNPTSGTDTK